MSFNSKMLYIKIRINTINSKVKLLGSVVFIINTFNTITIYKIFYILSPIIYI